MWFFIYSLYQNLFFGHHPFQLNRSIGHLDMVVRWVKSRGQRRIFQRCGKRLEILLCAITCLSHLVGLRAWLSLSAITLGVEMVSCRKLAEIKIWLKSCSKVRECDNSFTVAVELFKTFRIVLWGLNFLLKYEIRLYI